MVKALSARVNNFSFLFTEFLKVKSLAGGMILNN